MNRMFRVVVISNLILPVLLLAQIRIGYVDSNAIMSAMSEVADVQAELEKEQRKLEAEYTKMLGLYDSLGQNFEKQKFMMSDSLKASKMQEIQSLEYQIQSYQMEKFGPEGELYRLQSQLMGPIEQKIRNVIDEIGKDQKYDYIFDAQAGAILYAIDSHNLTEKVKDILKKQHESGKEEPEPEGIDDSLKK